MGGGGESFFEDPFLSSFRERLINFFIIFFSSIKISTIRHEVNGVGNFEWEIKMEGRKRIFHRFYVLLSNLKIIT